MKNYLHLAHQEDGLADVILTDEKVTIRDQEDDSFSKYYNPDMKRSKEKAACLPDKKMRKEYDELRVIEGTASVKDVLAVSGEKGVSMTVLLTAVYLCAIHEEMSKLQEKRPVILMVPVNLRKVFPSDSMLNFFGYIEPFHKFGEGRDEFSQILEEVKEYFDENLKKEQIARGMNELIAFEKNRILKMGASGT